MLSTNRVFNFGKAASTAFIPWSWLQVHPSSATGPVWPNAMTAFSSGTVASGAAALAGRINFGIISDVPAAAPRFSRPRRERLLRSIMLCPFDGYISHEPHVRLGRIVHRQLACQTIPSAAETLSAALKSRPRSRHCLTCCFLRAYKPNALAKLKRDVRAAPDYLMGRRQKLETIRRAPKLLHLRNGQARGLHLP